MNSMTLLLLLVGAAVVCCSAAAKFQPSVAFVCDRGAMHMHEDGTWLSDPNTDCMEGKKEILEYCKKSYPALEVTNIVESSEHQHIPGWCALGKSNCGTSEAFKVRPFRCLTGPFQSDALIVPKDCKFDHVHQPKQCQGFDWWSNVAHKACRGIQHMKTENFAMLLPCGTDMFTGVEYVCCPDGTNSTADELVADAKKPSIEVKVEPAKESVPQAKIANADVIENYLHMRESAYKDNEHDAFELAKKETTMDSHDKITKLMKDWAEARKRVLALKEIDPKGAEKMNKEITPRFQKEYFALQATGDSKVLQLDAVHQQHVQSNLDGKKRKTVEKLMSELQDDQPEPAAITKLLKRYINIEEKDAHHCIHHYTKIRDRDAANGRELLPTTLTHLTLISARINQSVGLLDALDSDSMKDKILVEVNEWRSKTFNNINKYITELKKELLANPATKPPRVKDQPKEEVADGKVQVVDKKPQIKLNIKPTKPDSKLSAKKVTDPAEGMYKQYADKFAAKAGVLRKPATPLKKVYDEEDEKENEHSYGKLMSPKVQANHMAQGVGLVANSNSFSSMSVSSSSISAGAGIGIAIGVAAGVLVVVLSVVLVRKKMEGGKPSKESYLEVSVEDNMSAEERHIASMQSGYENPTYKYLEKQGI